MKGKTFTLALGLTLAAFLVAQRHKPPAAPPPESASIIDLTHAISDKAPNWEGTAKSPFTAREVASVAKEGYFAREISLPEHFATHIDAPAHFAPGRWTVDQIPVSRLLGPLVVLDVTTQVRKDPDYRVQPDDIVAWERANGEIPAGAIVMARTGWDSRWNSMRDYRNADPKGVMHFPGYSVEAARVLVEGRQVVALGIDTLSVDYGASQDFPVHHYTAAHSVYHLENVADLWRVPEAGVRVLVAPAKLEGGSGGPVRILALLR